MIASILSKIGMAIVEKLGALAFGWLKLQASIKKDKNKFGKERDTVNDAVADIEKSQAEGNQITPEQTERLRDASRRLNGNFY